MKKLLLSLSLLAMSLTGFSKVWTITTSGVTFVEDTIRIAFGDTVVFKLTGTIHNAREVSKTTWLADESTSNGGFQTTVGTDTVLPASLAIGEHYYVCPPHVELGMKGLIIVESPTGLFSNKNIASSTQAYPNPFSNNLVVETEDADLITVYNAVGVKQFSVVVAKGQTQTQMDAVDLANGVYYFSIVKNGVVVDTKKVIKN